MARQYDHIDSAGAHPFREDGTDLPTPPEGEKDTNAEYLVTDYESTQASRGWGILLLSIGSVLGLAAMIYAGSEFEFYPLTILSWSLSLPPFFLGRSDLKAMRVGVMQRGQHSLTLAGTILSGVTALAALGIGFHELGYSMFRRWISWL